MKQTESEVFLVSMTDSPLKAIADAARTCYQSEEVEGGKTADMMVDKLNSSGHHAMLEFADATFQITTDIGISREIRTHRIASHAQESTRWCNYSGEKFGGELTFIKPPGMSQAQYAVWHKAVSEAEWSYLHMLDIGCKPQIARSVLPLSLKCQAVMKANFREWMHFIKLRDSFEAHPDIQDIARKISTLLNTHAPQLFESFE